MRAAVNGVRWRSRRWTVHLLDRRTATAAPDLTSRQWSATCTVESLALDPGHHRLHCAPGTPRAGSSGGDDWSDRRQAREGDRGQQRRREADDAGAESGAGGVVAHPRRRRGVGEHVQHPLGLGRWCRSAPGHRAATRRRRRAPPRSRRSGWRRGSSAPAAARPSAASPARGGRRSTRGADHLCLAKRTGRTPQAHSPASISPQVTSGGPSPSSVTASTRP